MKNAGTKEILKRSARKELITAGAVDGALAIGIDYAYQQGMIMTGRQEDWSPFQSGLTALGVLGGGMLSAGLMLSNKKLAKEQSTILDEIFGKEAI